MRHLDIPGQHAISPTPSNPLQPTPAHLHASEPWNGLRETSNAQNRRFGDPDPTHIRIWDPLDSEPNALWVKTPMVRV